MQTLEKDERKKCAKTCDGLIEPLVEVLIKADTIVGIMGCKNCMHSLEIFLQDFLITHAGWR